jgi:hypothetical protein
VAIFSPDFIAIVGYSFAKNGEDYDDRVSLESFLETRRNFRGNIYVVQPEPDALCAVIADGIKSMTVFGVPAYWNALSHAFMRTLCGRHCRKPIRYVYEKALAEHGADFAFAAGGRTSVRMACE